MSPRRTPPKAKGKSRGKAKSDSLMDLPLHASADEPFFRPQRRRRVRVARRGRLARMTLLLQLVAASALIGTAAWMAYTRVLASPRLHVAKIQVLGNQHLSENEVRELLGEALGQNILTVDIDALTARIMASPWVGRATVRRRLPDALEVTIFEREPLALAEVGGLYLMDEEGTLIDRYGPSTAVFDLPIVRGLQNVSAEERRERASRAGALLSDLDDLAVEVSEVEVETSGDVRIVLRGGGEVLRLGAPPYRERLATFLRMRGALTERSPRAEYFDLRFRSRIIVREPRAALAVGDGSGDSVGSDAGVVRQ